jgi:rod shape determining protein RodA
MIGNIDMLSVLLYCLLVFFGWLSIFSASSDATVVSIFDFSERYGKQLVWIGLSVILAIVILLIDAKFFSAFSFWIYFLMIGLLVFVLLFGKTVAGSKSWLEIGSISLQPAEFAKFATALGVAKYLSTLNIDMQKLGTKIRVSAIALFPAALILLQNDTGSALVYVAFVLVLFREGLSGMIIILGLWMAVLFVATLLFNEFYVTAALVAIALLVWLVYKKSRKHKRLMIFAAVFSIGFVFSVNYAFENVLEPHQKKRINVLLGIEKDIQGAGYNVNQSMIAIGSGGLTGKGFREGMLTRYHFVPEQTTDFIFCTVGEEWGFVGVSVVITTFLILLIRLIWLAERQRSSFSRIYGYGVASILFFHFAVNIAMTVGLAPVVGIPLPFFSYGGSSLWAFTILLFIFLKQDANRLNVL